MAECLGLCSLPSLRTHFLQRKQDAIGPVPLGPLHWVLNPCYSTQGELALISVSSWGSWGGGDCLPFVSISQWLPQTLAHSRNSGSVY